MLKKNSENGKKKLIRNDGFLCSNTASNLLKWFINSFSSSRVSNFVNLSCISSLKLNSSKTYNYRDIVSSAERYLYCVRKQVFIYTKSASSQNQNSRIEVAIINEIFSCFFFRNSNANAIYLKTKTKTKTKILTFTSNDNAHCLLEQKNSKIEKFHKMYSLHKRLQIHYLIHAIFISRYSLLPLGPNLMRRTTRTTRTIRSTRAIRSAQAIRSTRAIRMTRATCLCI